MATVVNARDVLLQGASTRIATVTMAPNLTVSQAQVSGLGIVLEGTKLVLLQATAQVFQIPKVGPIVPASSVLTALVKNIVGTVTLSVISGTITPAPALVGGTVTILPGNMVTDTATLRISVTENAITYTDEVTLVKVKEGADGITGLLTNESHNIPADQLGNVLSYSGCGGTFKMYQGNTDITNLCTYAVQANPSALTVVLNAATGVYSVTGGYPTGTDTTTVTLRATFGSTTYDKVFTITKAKNGTVGQRGSRTWYVGLTGTTAVYSDSLATTTASADGGPILNDTVTQYNDSQGFSQTKFWNGSAWVVVNAVVDGNLLVSGTIGATKVAANAIETYHVKAGAIDATKITVSDLSAIQASLGTVQINSNGYIRSNGATSYTTGTGFWMGYDTTTYKFRIGNPAGNKLEWTGTALNVVGDITGSTGTFGGSLAAGGGLFSVNGTTGAVSIKSATSGARLEIANNTIRVYDTSGVLRVKLGYLL